MPTEFHKLTLGAIWFSDSGLHILSLPGSLKQIMAAEKDRDEEPGSSSFTSLLLILVQTIDYLLESENEMYPFATVNCFKTRVHQENKLYQNVVI